MKYIGNLFTRLTRIYAKFFRLRRICLRHEKAKIFFQFRV